MTETATRPENRLARIVADRALSGASGILRASRGRLRRLFCFEQGRITFATSNLIEEQFGEHLAREGLLDAGTVSSATVEAARTEKRLAQVLREKGLADEADLRRGQEGLIERLFFETLEWPDGAFEFEAGRANLDGEVAVGLNPAVLLLRHARRFPAKLDQVRMRIGPPGCRPRVVEDRSALFDGVELGAAVEFLLRRCDGTHDLAGLVSASPAAEEETLRTLLGLVSTGAIDAARAAVVIREGGVPSLDRDECLAILARAEGGDHYGVLSLTRQAAAEAVRDAYYALARRYHPDRFRSGPLHDLLPRMEAYFLKVTEAYNTLSKPDLRADYDASFTAPATDTESARQSETSYLAKQNYLRAKSLLEKRRFAEAATFLENAARLDSSQAVYQRELGLVLARNPRRRADAERHLIRAAEIEPTSVAAYIALGQIYQRAGRLAHAARMYREALRWDPESAEASASFTEVAASEQSERVDFLQPILGG